MTFLTGSALTKKIKEITSGKDIRMAVAFWGRGAMEQLGLKKGGDWKIICNLSMGGTNPTELKKLGAAEENGGNIRHDDRLHAKVYRSSAGAVIASTNASANGLAFEAVETTGWKEAGVSVKNEGVLGQIDKWFEKLWEQSQEVTPEALETAEALWAKRRAGRLPLGHLSAIDPDSDDFPLLSWYGNSGYELDEAAVKRDYGEFNETIRQQIHNGIELEHQDDLPYLLNGRWVLQYKRNNNGNAAIKPHPEWTRINGRVIPKAYSYTGDETKERHNVVLVEPENNEPRPLPLNPEVITQITTLLNTEKYANLRTEDYNGAWFAPRIELMRQFWRDLKSAVST